MIHPIFPSRKPRTDALFFALGALALVMCFLLRDYWQFKPLMPGLDDRLQQVRDSILAKSDIARDSVEMSSEASVDGDLLDSIKAHYGASTRLFLDTADVQQILYRMRIRKKEKGGLNINFSTGNRSRPRSKSAQSLAEEGLSRTLWLNERGQIVGETQRLSENLLPATDTTALRERLLGLIPHDILRKLPSGAVWKRDTTDAEKIAFIAQISQDSLLKRELLVSAQKVSTSPVVWSAEWQQRISVRASSATAPSDNGGVSARTVIIILFWVMVGIAIVGLLIIWVNRLRLKAVNTWLLAIAVLSGLSMTSALLGMGEIPWYGLAIIFVFYTLGFGFFFIAVPIAGSISVLREICSEKFYTLMRFREKPLESFHWGRMILVGMSLGAIYTSLLLFVPIIGERFNISTLATLHLNTNYYSLPFVMRHALTGFLTTIGSVVPISFIFLIVPAMVIYWLVPRKYAMVGTLLLAVLAQALFESLQTTDIWVVLAHSFLRVVVGLSVLYFADMLALLASLTMNCFLISLGLFTIHPFVMVLLGVIFAVALVMSAIAYYGNAPETVTEADYKPTFLSLLEENERMHQEIAAAKSVQQKLLPRSLPTFESVIVSAACIPAYEVGGDYYDFFPLDDKRLGVLIGDVSGKGISAAFYITLAKGVIVSQVRGSGSPSDVLHRVNALLYGVMERGKFVSMIYGIYNTYTREFSFSNAGHNPLVVLRKSGDISTVAAKGMALGLDKGERFERAVTTASVTLEKGDCLLLYTDGVTEAMNAEHAEYGEERMMKTLRNAPLHAADLISATLADVRKFAGKAHQHDDITLVALQAM
ncbi:MAG: PP2C family protein-serine/threonine phosphatase [Candidatus Kapaibacteriota bacterium]